MVDLRIDLHYQIGMRVVKTGVAVMICMLMALVTGSMDTMILTTVTAIVTIRTSREETIRSGLLNMIATIIGGAIGALTVLIGLFLPYYSDGLFVIVIPLMILLNFYFCNVLGLQNSSATSSVVIILIAANVKLGSTVGDAYWFTLLRLRDTLIGVVIATLVNSVPHYIAKLFKK